MRSPNWATFDSEKKKVDSENSQFVALRDDGDAVTGVFVGDPHVRRVWWNGSAYAPCDGTEPSDAKPKVRVAMNFAVKSGTDWTVKVLENNQRFFDDVKRCDEKYDLTEWSFEIERHGAKGDPKTTYSVLPDDRLTDDGRSAIARLELIDLHALLEVRDDRASAPANPNTDAER